MQTKTNSTRISKLKKTKEEYSEELIQEVKEAQEDYKQKRFFKGSAEEVIKHLKDEANRVKKI